MRILVVDDYPDAAESLAQLLQMHGHDVRFANSSKEAAANVNGFSPEVLIVDIMLPDDDGYIVARELCRSALKKPVLIAVTGYESLEARSKREGFDYHFVKPVDGPKLLSALQHVLKSRLIDL